MLDFGFCPECNVPQPFTQANAWLNNGDIVQKANAEARIAFLECENLDPLFRNIGDIIGVSIEHLIVNITARAFANYLDPIIPKEVKEMVQAKTMEPTFLIDFVSTLAQISGFGKYEWIDYRYEKDADDFSLQHITEPYSLPLTAGGFAGALSASVGGEHSVTYREIAPKKYEFVTHWSQYPAILKDKLRLPVYRHRDGGLELESCSTCGGPAALRECRWILERGIIVNQQSGKRMAMLGPATMDPIFTALETELDESVPGIVIEAQRRFVKTGFYPIDILESEDNLRTRLALRGLGNLHHLKLDANGVHMRLDNPCLHLITLGLVQGAFELALDLDSNLDWELTEDGSLELEVTPKRI
jgi:predicted house-cleaning noncanonical NTP pyrophosphatase (MazG superfamily)